MYYISKAFTLLNKNKYIVSFEFSFYLLRQLQKLNVYHTHVPLSVVLFLQLHIKRMGEDLRACPSHYDKQGVHAANAYEIEMIFHGKVCILIQ